MVNTEIRSIIFFAAKDGETLYSQQKQDQELTVAQIMNSLLQNSDLKKVEKTSRPFSYDLNQTPYNFTVGVTNWFMGLDLIECLKNYGRMFITLYSKQWSKPSPWKRNAKGKMVVWRGLTNSWEKWKWGREELDMDCSLPGSSIHGTFQARVLDWVAIAFSEWFPLLSSLCQ